MDIYKSSNYSMCSTYNLIFARDSLKRMMASSCLTVMGIAAALPVS
jgi:hypothetical protein